MKKNHIKIVLLFLFLQLSLNATTYEWSASTNKKRAYVNEAIYLSYECVFSDRAELYAVEFNPLKKDENLTIVMLSETSKVEDGKKILLYEFVAFVHKAQKMAFEFETTMKKTTKESIENTVIGRDNGKYAEYKKEKIKQKKLEVEILETQTALVGDLELKIKKDKEEVKALNPYHLEVKIEGIGDFEALSPLAFEIEGVKLFSEKPIKKFELTKEGYQGVWSQKFAFVAEKDFTIKPFSIGYFDLKTQEKKELRFDGVFVHVKEGYKKEELLDKKHKTQSFFKREYFYYLLTFIVGFLLAKIQFRKKDASREDSFCTKVKNANSLNALSILLVIQNAEKYKSLISQIEDGELSSLQKCKKLICG